MSLPFYRGEVAHGRYHAFYSFCGQDSELPVWCGSACLGGLADFCWGTHGRNSMRFAWSLLAHCTRSGDLARLYRHAFLDAVVSRLEEEWRLESDWILEWTARRAALPTPAPAASWAQVVARV